MKLHQLIAIVSDKKTQAQAAQDQAYKALQKPDLFKGLIRTYNPLEDGGERLPSESQKVNLRVEPLIKDVNRVISDMMDHVFRQDVANSTARADIEVDGQVIAKSVPVTNLMFLEKQVKSLETFIGKMPILDPTEDWEFDEVSGCYKSSPRETARTKKVIKYNVVVQPTKEHPAQVKEYTEDILAGYWSTAHLGGGIKAVEKDELLTRVRKLSEAIKIAREQANTVEVPGGSIGKNLLTYVFGENSIA